MPHLSFCLIPQKRTFGSHASEREWELQRTLALFQKTLVFPLLLISQKMSSWFSGKDTARQQPEIQNFVVKGLQFSELLLDGYLCAEWVLSFLCVGHLLTNLQVLLLWDFLLWELFLRDLFLWVLLLWAMSRSHLVESCFQGISFPRGLLLESLFWFLWLWFSRGLFPSRICLFSSMLCLFPSRVCLFSSILCLSMTIFLF